MTALFYTLGVVIFVVAILASVGLHELGHMIPAKKFGGKVTQYFIGFGPTVWSRQRGETEYGVKAIPLGGYVKIVGMLPPGADELDEDREHPVYDEDGRRVVRVRKSNTGMFTQLISDARAAEYEHIGPDDDARLPALDDGVDGPTGEHGRGHAQHGRHGGGVRPAHRPRRSEAGQHHGDGAERLHEQPGAGEAAQHHRVCRRHQGCIDQRREAGERAAPVEGRERIQDQSPWKRRSLSNCERNR